MRHGRSRKAKPSRSPTMIRALHEHFFRSARAQARFGIALAQSGSACAGGFVEFRATQGANRGLGESRGTAQARPATARFAARRSTLAPPQSARPSCSRPARGFTPEVAEGGDTETSGEPTDPESAWLQVIGLLRSSELEDWESALTQMSHPEWTWPSPESNQNIAAQTSSASRSSKPQASDSKPANPPRVQAVETEARRGDADPGATQGRAPGQQQPYKGSSAMNVGVGSPRNPNEVKSTPKPRPNDCEQPSSNSSLPEVAPRASAKTNSTRN